MSLSSRRSSTCPTRSRARCLAHHSPAACGRGSSGSGSGGSSPRRSRSSSSSPAGGGCCARRRHRPRPDCRWPRRRRLSTTGPHVHDDAVRRPTAPPVLVVHVAGAVVRPGVYELPGGARVHAAARRRRRSPARRRRRAPSTSPRRSPTAPASTCPSPARRSRQPRSPPAVAPSVGAAAGPLDLNRATAGELDELPGIGPATAQAIVDHRTANGPFASVDELEAVRGIGPAKLEAIRALVTRVMERGVRPGRRRRRTGRRPGRPAAPTQMPAGEPGSTSRQKSGHVAIGLRVVRWAAMAPTINHSMHAQRRRRSGTPTSLENGAPTASRAGAAKTPEQQAGVTARLAVERR